MDHALFNNPPKPYREVPFWSWNDELDPQELRRQVAVMDEAGWGGFFMHARVGLRTAYMGQRWIECIRACVDEARQRGLGAWLYDEDKWPSGFAGGLSVAGEPTFRSQYLTCKVDNRPALIAERIATFFARQVSGQLADVRWCDVPTFNDEADRSIQFYPQTMPLGFAKFNDYCYLNLLNPQAVRAFLDSTHEAYARAIGDEFGQTVPGIFTDEPSYLIRHDVAEQQPTIPWVQDFPAYFQARNGYDLLPHLPSLFFDVGDFHAVRYDYWRTVTQRFVESYSQQIYEWCETRGLACTGHYMAEDTLLSQIFWIGAAMPHYAYMHIPGIDKLGRSVNTGAGRVLTVKQLDSAACQLGRTRTLCENYGCAGQDLALAGRKWIGDWAYVLGINLNNPHLSLYSMRGKRKRDYPATLFFQQPWWKENHLVADHLARLSAILSQGQRVVDILVIHPIGSAWAVYRPQATREVDQLDQPLDELLMMLLQAQRDFHLGDEMLMEPGAACEGNVRADARGARLDVGLMRYRVVIVPPGVTLAANTVRLLREFAEAGGSVLALEPMPTRINGRAATEPVLPQTTRVVTLQTLPGVLDEVLPFDVCAPGQPSIWAHHRRVDGAEVYFLANINPDHGAVATVRLRGTGALEEWDTVTGQARPLATTQRDGVTEVTLDLAASGSHLLVLNRDKTIEVAHTPKIKTAEMALGNAWKLKLDGPNALTLDTPQVKLGEGEWSAPMHSLDAHDQVAQAGSGAAFGLRFTFEAAVCPPAPIYLVAESPEEFIITVNQRTVATPDLGWWVDTAFRKVDISAAVQAGRNEIVLSGIFTRDTELESLYLIGAFGVEARRLRQENRFNGQVFDRYAAETRLIELPAQSRADLTGGLALDLTAHGLPFFAGRVVLRQVVQLPSHAGPAELEFDNLRAAVAHVRVNGQAAGATAWPPHRADMTGHLRPGANEIEIELVSTLRNLLGPHHLNGGDLEWTGPGQFRDKLRWTDDVILVPFGFDGIRLALYR